MYSNPPMDYPYLTPSSHQWSIPPTYPTNPYFTTPTTPSFPSFPWELFSPYYTNPYVPTPSPILYPNHGYSPHPPNPNSYSSYSSSPHSYYYHNYHQQIQPTNTSSIISQYQTYSRNRRDFDKYLQVTHPSFKKNSNKKNTYPCSEKTKFATLIQHGRTLISFSKSLKLLEPTSTPSSLSPNSVSDIPLYNENREFKPRQLQQGDNVDEQSSAVGGGIYDFNQNSFSPVIWDLGFAVPEEDDDESSFQSASPDPDDIIILAKEIEASSFVHDDDAGSSSPIATQIVVPILTPSNVDLKLLVDKVDIVKSGFTVNVISDLSLHVIEQLEDTVSRVFMNIEDDSNNFFSGIAIHRISQLTRCCSNPFQILDGVTPAIGDALLFNSIPYDPGPLESLFPSTMENPKRTGVSLLLFAGQGLERKPNLWNPASQIKVDSLEEITSTMGSTYWKFDGDSCQIQMLGLTKKPPDGSQSSIACDCFSQNDTFCHIVRMEFKGYNLPGTFPPQLVKLPYLKVVDFALNYLNSTIPKEWGSVELTSISLLVNRLSGEIPKELGNITTLTYLNLEAIDVFVQALESEEDGLCDGETFLSIYTIVSQIQPIKLAEQVHAFVLKSLSTSKGFNEEALMLVGEMQKQQFFIDFVTASVLFSVASIGRQTHAYLIHRGIQFEGMASCLIDMYAKSGSIKLSELLYKKNCYCDKVYNSALYIDLGNSDKGSEHACPILGGSAEYLYPHKGRTCRKPAISDLNYESRLDPELSLNIYIQRDERFSHLMSDFLAYALKSIVQVLKPELESLFDSTPNEFDSFENVLKLYENGMDEPEHLLKDFRDNIHGKMLNKIFRTDGEKFLNFSTPQVIAKDKSTWITDEEFAREMLAGINPVMISSLQEFPPQSKLDHKLCSDQSSKITKEHIEITFDGITVDEEIRERKLFILDHNNSLMPYLRRTNSTSPKTYSSRTILFLQKNGTLSHWPLS